MGNVYMEAEQVRFKNSTYRNVQEGLAAALEGGGGGGTTVVANPEGSATANLSKLQVGTTIYGIPAEAGDISYDNTSSGLTADDVQEAVDEVATDIGSLSTIIGDSSAGLVKEVTDIQDLIPSGATSSNKLATASDIPDAVTGNPSGSATAGNLTKLQIGSDIYNVPSGGSNAYGIYSGTETEVGTWNNAPLYRKIVTIGYLPTTGTKTATDELPVGAVARHIWGMCFTSPQDPYNGYTLTLPLMPFSDLNEAITIGVYGRDVYVTVGKDRSSMYGYVVVEYTKAS